MPLARAWVIAALAPNNHMCSPGTWYACDSCSASRLARSLVMEVTFLYSLRASRMAALR